MTGRQLMESGLRVRLAARPQVAWVVYQRVQGLAAMAEADCPRGEIPLAVVFDGKHSTNAGGAIRRHAWDFGDGTTAEGPAVKHVYGTPGTYTAKLTVANERGTTDQASVVVVATPVDSAPPAIARIDSSDPRKVVATFSKPVEQSSAEAAANYAIDGGVRIRSASLGEDGAVVTLGTSPLSPGVNYVLRVSGVKDRANTQRHCGQLAEGGLLHRPSGSLETRRGQRRRRRGLFRQRTSGNPQERTAMGRWAARRGLELWRTC